MWFGQNYQTPDIVHCISIANIKHRLHVWPGVPAARAVSAPGALRGSPLPPPPRPRPPAAAPRRTRVRGPAPLPRLLRQARCAVIGRQLVHSSLIGPGPRCLACTNPEYFICPESGVCVHPALVCDGHPACSQVSWDWWRAGHVTTILTSDWPGPSTTSS